MRPRRSYPAILLAEAGHLKAKEQVRRFILIPLLCIAGCDQDSSQAALGPTEKVAIVTPTQAAQKQVRDLKERLVRARETCESGPTRYDDDGAEAMAEVDVAMAENIENVSPEQEQRIRASIGAEMGLAPSEVNGWKAIYRSRAEQARRRLAEREKVQRSACEYVPTLEAELREAEEAQRAQVASAPASAR